MDKRLERLRLVKNRKRECNCCYKTQDFHFNGGKELTLEIVRKIVEKVRNPKEEIKLTPPAQTDYGLGWKAACDEISKRLK